MSKRKSTPREGRGPGHGRPREASRNDPGGRSRQPGSGTQKAGPDPWLYGRHVVEAVIRNPARVIERVVVTEGAKEDALQALSDRVSSADAHGAGAPPPCPPPETVERDRLDGLLPEGALHQGMAARVRPLDDVFLEDICRAAAVEDTALVVVLDQITDPHNVGAVLRSAAAFGATAAIVQDRHAPDITGVLAKSASGAVETVPLVRVTNLARALEDLKEAGFWTAGLDGRAETRLDRFEANAKTALVLGAEGTGLRRLVADACDVLLKIPIDRRMESLNVSNACAIALYEMSRRR